MLLRPVTCGLLLWALSPQVVAQSAPAQKAKPPSKALSQARPAAPTPQARARSTADVTARLQAQAIAAAAAAARPALSSDTVPDAHAGPASVAHAVASAPSKVPQLSPSPLASEPPMGMLPPMPVLQRMTEPVPLPVVPMPASVPAPPIMADLSVQPMPMTVVVPAQASLHSPASLPQSGLAQPGAASTATDIGSQELAIAQRIHQGVLPCERGTSVRVEADARRAGYFRVMGKGFRYSMRPVPTSTGALRLEDAQAGAVWLQLANKSMLMDQKKGRRLADDCAHPEQVAFANDMKTNPPPMLFDTQGMGRSKD